MNDKNSLHSIVKIAGVQLNDAALFWKKQVVRKAKRIIGHPDHILSQRFVLMPPGQRHYAPLRKTNRYSNSFFPSAVTLLNREQL